MCVMRFVTLFILVYFAQFVCYFIYLSLYLFVVYCVLFYLIELVCIGTSTAIPQCCILIGFSLSVSIHRICSM